MATSVAPLSDVSPGASRGRRRSFWWVVHGWVGLKLSIFLTWVLLTGTLAVFSVEMDWLARPALRVAPQDAPHASWGTLAAAAQAAVPEAKITSIYAAPHAWFASEAVAEQSKERIRVYINPYSGKVQGTGPWLSFQRFFREMHRHLLPPAKWGIPIVSSLSILLLMSLVTGLVSYKKFWRGFFRRPRVGNGRRLAGDLHRSAGLWSLWFLALISLTGLWYLVESLGGDAPYSKPPKLEGTVPRLDASAIDRAERVAMAAYPSLRIREVRLPTQNGEAVGFFGQGDAVLVRDRVNGVWIDPELQQAVQILKGEELTVHQRISEMADPLHFGTFGGMASKILWFLFGLILTGLAVTGVIIFSLRLKNSQAPDDSLRAPRGAVARARRGMGVWFYPAAAIVLLSLAMLPGWLSS